MHRTGPKAVEMTECVLRVVQLQIDTEVLVKQIELSSVAVVPVLDPDDRLTEIGQVEQQPLLDLLELTALDLVGVVLIVVLVTEDLMTTAEVDGQEGVDERHIVVSAANLEDLPPAKTKRFVPLPPCLVVIAFLPFRTELPLVPALFDISQQLDTELVGIEAARLGGHCPRVVVGVIDELRGMEDLLGHDRRVPERGPALVHDLGLALGG